MITLKLTGWRPELRKVSLIQAIRDYSTASLGEANAMLDELLSGRTVTLVFENEESRDEFRRLAEDLGVSVSG